ncbi:MAG: ribonuclease T [Gammaproteobacteria bacterium]|nr:ribonuclease T [Gammaproteobacteria bacterium]
MSEMSSRFRGFLPVVIDLETGGFDKDIHAVLQIAAVSLEWFDESLAIDRVRSWNVIPHPGTMVEEASLRITGIDLADPERDALDEEEAVRELFRFVRREVRRNGCERAVLTAHNAHFDHGFVTAAAERNGVKRNPFHPFTVIDTASLAAVAYGHTVLSEACARAGIEFEGGRAHAARYDAEATAKLFCLIVNDWERRHMEAGG